MDNILVGKLPMNDAVVFLVYALTLMGLLGLSWAFYRLFQQLKNWLRFPTEWISALSLVLSLILGYFTITTIYTLVFKCFTAMHCSSSQSGEMIVLSQFAVILMIYELLLFILSLCRKRLY